MLGDKDIEKLAVTFAVLALLDHFEILRWRDLVKFLEVSLGNLSKIDNKELVKEVEEFLKNRK